MPKFDYLNTELDQLEKQNLRRKLTTIDSPQGPTITVNGNNLSLFASNNYLNLANDPAIRQAAHDAIEEFGYCSGASRLVSGTMKPHTDAEKALAKFVYQEASLLFPSGWMANEAVIKTIPQKGDLLILDKLNHASIIDAAMASDAEFRTFRRDNTAKLEKLLANKNYNRKFIITESVFSMDGDCADLKTLVHLKNKYDAYLIVDEAHAFGCMGPNGAGLADELGLLNEVDIFIATLSKSFAAAGGIVAAPKPVIDYLVNRARPFIYTTAPSPVNAAVILASLGIIQSQPKLRQQLKANADYLRENLKRLGFDTSQSTTHIIPVIIGDEGKTLKIAKLLLDNGFYIPAIRPPTVPAGTSRLRISVQAGHSAEQLDKLISFLGSIKNIA